LKGCKERAGRRGSGKNGVPLEKQHGQKIVESSLDQEQERRGVVVGREEVSGEKSKGRGTGVTQGFPSRKKKKKRTKDERMNAST